MALLFLRGPGVILPQRLQARIESGVQLLGLHREPRGGGLFKVFGNVTFFHGSSSCCMPCS